MNISDIGPGGLKPTDLKVGDEVLLFPNTRYCPRLLPDEKSLVRVTKERAR